MRENLETGLLMSVAIALAHPEQYALTRASLEKLASLRHICQFIDGWAFAFNVLTIVVNREAWLHRDKMSGALALLDMLLNIGGDPGTVLELPGVGVRLQYDSGTAAIFSGHTHIHGVSRSTEERVCFAAYVRPSVHRLFGLHTPDAPTVVRPSQYAQWIHYIESVVAWARS